jgi:hypothetical protein
MLNHLFNLLHEIRYQLDEDYRRSTYYNKVVLRYRQETGREFASDYTNNLFSVYNWPMKIKILTQLDIEKGGTA